MRAAIEQGWSTFHSSFKVVWALTLAGYVGIWRMKKWGLVLYALTVAVNATLVWLVCGYPPAGVLVGALIAAVVVVIVLSQFSKMD